MKLSEGIERYLLSRRANGGTHRAAELSFVGFRKHVGDLDLIEVTSKDILTYLDGSGTSTITWRRKHQMLDRFFEFWAMREVMPQLLMPPQRPRVRQTFIPYVYKRSELRALMAITSQTQIGTNLERETFRTLLMVLYGTGALLSETLALRVPDVDLVGGSLTLRSARSHRIRKIPIGRDLQEVLGVYSRWRTRKGIEDDHLFVCKDGRILRDLMVQYHFRRLRRIAAIIRNDGASYRPRMQDLRYTFAVHRITSWIKNGADLNHMLPALAAYMGQAGLGATERYLSMTPERFRKNLNKLSPSRGRKGWRNDEELMHFLISL